MATHDLAVAIIEVGALVERKVWVAVAMHVFFFWNDDPFSILKPRDDLSLVLSLLRPTVLVYQRAGVSPYSISLSCMMPASFKAIIYCH